MTTCPSNEWLAGGGYSLADICNFAIANGMEMGFAELVNDSDTPHLMRWLEQMNARPAVQEMFAKVPREALRAGQDLTMAKTKAKSRRRKLEAAAAIPKTKPAKAKPCEGPEGSKRSDRGDRPRGAFEGDRWSFPRAPFALQGYAFGEAYPTTMFHCAIRRPREPNAPS